MAKKLTSKDYQNALITLGRCIRQDLTEMAKDQWKDNPDLKEDFETYEEFRDEWIQDVLDNDEYIAGHDLMEEIKTAIENVA